MTSPITPYFAKLYSSDSLKKTKRAMSETKRKITGKAHTLNIFIRADDPYSYLLIQVLPNFLSRFKVKANFYTTYSLQQDMYPEPEMWRTNAEIDARCLADLYNLDFPDISCQQTSDITQAITAQLLNIEKEEDFLSKAEKLLHSYWHGGKVNVSPMDAHTEQQLQNNEQTLKSMGHYFSAMIEYAGEWYWGLDRLDHLEHRLIQLGLNTSSNESVLYDRTYQDFCTHNADLIKDKHTPLEIFWSARSPYSYIGLIRAYQLSQHYGIPLIIKPVLPMVMRNMAVPKTKKFYIFLDTKREADKLNIPYGFVADPLGAAVERCYALLSYAEEEGKLNEFLVSFANGVNAQGIRGDTDKGMKVMVERCGLNWEEAKPLLNSEDWRPIVDANLKEMFSLGCWGVPSYRYGELILWGQDRLKVVENAIIGSE